MCCSVNVRPVKVKLILFLTHAVVRSRARQLRDDASRHLSAERVLPNRG